MPKAHEQLSFDENAVFIYRSQQHQRKIAHKLLALENVKRRICVRQKVLTYIIRRKLHKFRTLRTNLWRLQS